MIRSIGVCIVAAALAVAADPVRSQESSRPPVDSYLAKIKQRGTLNIGLKSDILGVGFQNPMTGKFEGFTVDLALDLAARIFGGPGHVTFKPTLPVTRITMLQQGVIDADIETLFISQERWQQIDFSEPYWAAPSRIFISKTNTTITELKDLEGKRIAATKGSLAERQFRDPGSGYPRAQLVMFDSIAQSIEAIRVGRADAAVFDEVFGLAAMKATPDFKFVGEPVRFDYYGVGIAKGHPDLVEFINGWLRDIKANGRWAQMYRNNLPGDAPAPPLPPFDKAYYK
jgi:ABC-type amino acid transport substrate-binding protein